MAQARKTATYRVVTDSGGGRIFRFYCDIFCFFHLSFGGYRCFVRRKVVME